MRGNIFAPARELARPGLNGGSHSPTDRSSMTMAKSKLEEIEALGRRCKDGDCAAWSLLFPQIWPVLVTFVHRLYHSFDQQDAEDVAQASIEAAVGAIDTFSENGLFRAWLFGIAVRQAGNFYRSSSAKKRGAQLRVPLNGFDDHKDEAKSPAEVSADNDRAAILHRAIDLLPEADRDLVHLHFFGELTFREIAETRRMNPKTVCTRLTRCKEKLLVTLARFDLTKSDG
jgi:RNA polymerase sigma-70 factor (ECF subfamily)